MLTKAPTILLTHTRIGEQLFEYEPREIRRLLVGHYEMRYDIQKSIIYKFRFLRGSLGRRAKRHRPATTGSAEH